MRNIHQKKVGANYFKSYIVIIPKINFVTIEMKAPKICAIITG